MISVFADRSLTTDVVCAILTDYDMLLETMWKLYEKPDDDEFQRVVEEFDEIVKLDDLKDRIRLKLPIILKMNKNDYRVKLILEDLLRHIDEIKDTIDFYVEPITMKMDELKSAYRL
jgi:hypothetical protein